MSQHRGCRELPHLFQAKASEAERLETVIVKTEMFATMTPTSWNGPYVDLKTILLAGLPISTADKLILVCERRPPTDSNGFQEYPVITDSAGVAGAEIHNHAYIDATYRTRV